MRSAGGRSEREHPQRVQELAMEDGLVYLQCSCMRTIASSRQLTVHSVLQSSWSDWIASGDIAKIVVDDSDGGDGKLSGAWRLYMSIHTIKPSDASIG